MAAAAHAVDGAHRNGSTPTDASGPVQQGLTTSSEQHSPAKRSMGDGRASHRGSDVDAAREASRGDAGRRDASNVGRGSAHRGAPARATEHAPDKARSVVQGVVAGTDPEHATGTPKHPREPDGEEAESPAGPERFDPGVAGGRVAARVVKHARDSVLSHVHDTVHSTVGETCERVHRTRGHSPPDRQPCNGSPPTRPHPGTVEPPLELAHGAQRLLPGSTSTVTDPAGQAGLLGATADEGISPGPQRPAERRTRGELAGWQPANPAGNPACPNGLDACALPLPPTNLQPGPDQREPSGLSNVTEPSALGLPGAAARSPHDAWVLPSSPAFVPEVSPD
jgi:hypothetical protein